MHLFKTSLCYANLASQFSPIEWRPQNIVTVSSLSCQLSSKKVMQIRIGTNIESTIWWSVQIPFKGCLCYANQASQFSTIEWELNESLKTLLSQHSITLQIYSLIYINRWIEKCKYDSSEYQHTFIHVPKLNARAMNSWKWVFGIFQPSSDNFYNYIWICKVS